ncbi:hypothetical protein G6L00_09465 [Agrobacterium rhizogenes]|nr:hypothetical protein [Rhizobium rhizogenes]NTH38157.1 hypothetical protein [Rhizobium rhizogenes]NTJ00587.1 hypothetical protein [Rhizobium rhizogenes]
MRTGKGIFALTVVGVLLSIFMPRQVTAENTPKTFSPDLKELCAPNPLNPPTQWLISKQLSPKFWASRLSCDAQASPTVLRISVHPGDAANPNPDDNPTERVEAQLRQEVVKFDQPTWYHFRFRLEAPWEGTDNRTVIHQVKQDIPSADQLPQGSCHAAIPFFAIQARRSPTGADFLARVHGATDCNQGKSKTICGPWHADVGTWNDVHVLLKPSLIDGASEVRVWFNGRSCKPYFGVLGYADHGARDSTGHPFVNAQPRFGIYRDALPDMIQTIEFSDISFWSSPPTHDPAWSSITLPHD